jgi:hypothetical protein
MKKLSSSIELTENIISYKNEKKLYVNELLKGIALMYLIKNISILNLSV